MKERQRTPLATPTDLTAAAVRDITGGLNAMLADVFSLYVKTKNFHWHLSGPHFRDYHTASLIEQWIDETERRTWFLFESAQAGATGGH